MDRPNHRAGKCKTWIMMDQITGLEYTGHGNGQTKSQGWKMSRCMEMILSFIFHPEFGSSSLCRSCIFPLCDLVRHLQILHIPDVVILWFIIFCFCQFSACKWSASVQQAISYFTYSRITGMHRQTDIQTNNYLTWLDKQTDRQTESHRHYWKQYPLAALVVNIKWWKMEIIKFHKQEHHITDK